MSAEGDGDDLYSRGGYRLAWDRRRDGTLRSPFLQIIWYDESAGRNRSKSAGTANERAAEEELDKLYLKRERGQNVCPTCGQLRIVERAHLLTTAIADYLVARAKKPSIGSIRPRLAHVANYLVATDQIEMACDNVDADWIDEFREWATEVPITSPNGVMRERSAGTVEASVRQLAAAINFAHGRKDTLYPAGFSAKPPAEVSQTPTYRATVAELAAMFDYCINPARRDDDDARAIAIRAGKRGSLLRFLQISVATWCRPDAAHDVSTDPARRQWHSNAHALDLNPKGRAQTRKYRPTIPIGERMARLLDSRPGFYVGVDSVRQAFETMQTALGLPRERETGLKLIRRSMATLARRRLGEEHWIQGEIMLGHRKMSSSDIYALFEPGQLGRALAVTNEIIEEIETRVPGAFHRKGTGLQLLEGGLRS